jgi:hypothetical protein
MNPLYFARLLNTAGVDACLALLIEARGAPLGELLRRDDETITVFAPDGDVVFAAIAKQPGIWICRLHHEVFNPGQIPVA